MIRDIKKLFDDQEISKKLLLRVIEKDFYWKVCIFIELFPLLPYPIKPPISDVIVETMFIPRHLPLHPHIIPPLPSSLILVFLFVYVKRGRSIRIFFIMF